MSTYRLKNLLSPRSVALIGASPRQGSVGRAILNNIGKANFKGEFGLVNPRYPEIDGIKTVGSLARLSFVPELVVLTAPAKSIAGLIDEAGHRGTAGAVIVSAGLGHGPGSLAEAAEHAAQKYGMRLIGPNCLGIMMPCANLNASFSAHMPDKGNLALISQSGAIAAGMVDWAAQRAVGFSGIVSIGDQLDVDIADLLDYFAMDQKTQAILLYIEAIKDARKFMSAARAAARIKPVVVVKSGRMAQGAKAAATHTGALAGSDAVYDAAFRRAGVLRVSDLRELFDCAETLGASQIAAGQAAGDPDQWRRHRRARGRSAGRTRRHSRRHDARRSGRSSTRCCRRHGRAQTPSISSAMPTPRAMRRRSKCCWPIPAMTPFW